MADTLNDIFCPACGKKMKKIFMPSAGVNLDICADGCGGIFFDNREFEKFDEMHEDISPLAQVLDNSEYYEVDTSLTRVCPVCGMNMVKTFSSSKHDVEIDNCYGCGGIFLDNGELQQIRAEYPDTEARAADVIKELYSNVGFELTKTKAKNEKLKNRWGAKLIREYVKFGTKISKGL